MSNVASKVNLFATRENTKKNKIFLGTVTNVLKVSFRIKMISSFIIIVIL